MASIKMFDKVLLKTGEVAYVVEIFSNPTSYICDIQRAGGEDTDFVYPDEIAKVFG